MRFQIFFPNFPFTNFQSSDLLARSGPAHLKATVQMGGQHFSSLVSLAFVCLVSEKISPTTTRRKKEWENGERKERQKIQPTRFHWIRCSSRTCHKPRNLRRQRPHQEKKAQRSFFFLFFPRNLFSSKHVQLLYRSPALSCQCFPWLHVLMLNCTRSCWF